MPKDGITIPHKFTPRDYQRPLYNSLADGYKRGVAIWHRRAGKDKTLLNIITKEAMKRVGSYYYFFPRYTQGRKALWEGKDKSGFPFLGHIPNEIRRSTNNTEMRIELTNGSIFRVIGTDRYDDVMGSNPVGLVFSEYSLQKPSAWDFFRPILTENGGWALFNYTPRGKNHGFDLYKMALKNPEWFCQLLTVDDTRAISQEDIDRERAEGMTEDLVQQEYYCSFEASIPGAYFRNEMRAMAKTGRLLPAIPKTAGIPVHTFWDLGMDDSTTIWLVQIAAGQPRFVGFYRNSGEGLTHYVNWLKDWRDLHQMTLGTVVLPHDGAVRDLSTGKSRKKYIEELGLRDVEVMPRPEHKPDGIEASRRALASVWMDETACETGIDGLRQYRKEYDEENGVYAVRPVHDWASHVADAFQTFALWWQKQQGKGKPQYPSAARGPRQRAGAGWMK